MVGISRSKPVGKLPPRIGGKYRPIRIIGRGGMSVVYEVEHEFTKDRLALKVLNGNGVLRDPVALARFRREARVSTLVRSEHIVRVFDADIAADLNGAPFLVMDLLRGKSLAAVTGNQPQSPERVVGWLRQVARGLDLAHQHGVVHRDLKPENLFLTERADGTTSVKVLDFGVASIPALDEAHGTATGAFVGTPLFMSPEQAAGGDVSPSADVWSVGIGAFRLLTGRNYWEAANVNLLLAKIVYESVAAPSERGLELGAAFDAWFARSCARAPGERWPSVGVQVEALAASLGLPVLEIPVPVAVDFVPLDPSSVSEGADGMGEVRSDSLGAAITTSASDQFGRPGLLVALALAVSAISVVLLFREARDPPDHVEQAAASVPARAPVESATATSPVASPSVPSDTPAVSLPASSHPADPMPPRPKRKAGAPAGELRRATDPQPVGEPPVSLPRASLPVPGPEKQTLPAAPSSTLSEPVAPVDRGRDPLADPD